MSKADWPKYKPVVILGAGPAGLSVGYELARRGVDFVILEKGADAGESFSLFPRNIFFGPWINNLLPGSKVSWSWLLRRSTQPAYAWYLAEYGRQNHLPIFNQTSVHNVRQEDGRFVVETSRGEIWCRLVVNATGYFSKPFIPNYPGLAPAATSPIPYMHVARYRDVESARAVIGKSSGRVLVVGKRLSAGETMCELHRSGFQVALSHRGRLKIGPSPAVEALLSPFSYLYERLSVLLRVHKDSYPPMAGGESTRYIKSGQVQTYPDVSRIEGDEVHFQDGRSDHFDLIIFATGYEPALDHLRPLLNSGTPQLNGMESATAPGLFFVGIDNQRTYRSRFLRGITEDSRVVAELVARRVSGWGASAATGQHVVVPNEVLIDLDHSPQEAAAS